MFNQDFEIKPNAVYLSLDGRLYCVSKIDGVELDDEGNVIRELSLQERNEVVEKFLSQPEKPQEESR